MVKLKTKEEIAILREAGKKAAFILNELKKDCVPGASTMDINKKALQMCKDAGAEPSFLGYQPWTAPRPFPAALCVSVNDVIIHGIPNEKPIVLKEGDIVSLDIGLIYKGLFVDTAVSIGVGEIDTKAAKLLEAGQKSLDAAIFVCKPGIRTGDIGHAVESAMAYYKKTYGFNLADPVLGGHGVGHGVHEDPFVPNSSAKNQGYQLKPGLVIAIEPMVNEGTWRIKADNDGYTYRTGDGKRSVHFEHTVAITEDGVEVLTEL
ncbi:MAG: hypothetical protein RL094_210 [Candidatus Parcubacteria bacterium]|jgi:methionyl aminopeptidase